MKKITKLSIATLMVALIALTLTFAPSKYAHACDFNCICDEEIEGDNDDTACVGSQKLRPLTIGHTVQSERRVCAPPGAKDREGGWICMQMLPHPIEKYCCE